MKNIIVGKRMQERVTLDWICKYTQGGHKWEEVRREIGYKKRKRILSSIEIY